MLKLIPEETALLVIDPQNDYCHADGLLAQSGVNIGPMYAAIPAIAQLIKRCQAAGIQDIWSRHYNLADDKGRAAKRLQPHTAKRKRVTSQPGTWGSEFVDELKPLINDKSWVFPKYRFNCFYGTPLENLLKMGGKKLLVICGGTTNACVETTIREAYMRDYDLVMVGDCIGAVRPDWHVMALEVWKHYLGEVVNLSEFEQMLDPQGRVA